MPYFYAIVKADYLQRTRTYSFLIALAVTVFMAYSFIPANDANYTTLSAAGYRGVYNSAWIGYVSAIMTTVMLSYYGFLLVNSGIKKDIDTEVGLIIATTAISNFKYLLSKLVSNYLVLLTIVAVTFIVSIAVFFLRGTGYPFILSNFLLPYLFFAIPTLFVVSALAVTGEVFLGKRNILQFIAYFSLVGVCVGLINSKSGADTNGFFDPFGLSLLTKNITQHLNSNFNENIATVNFGFIINGQRIYKPFVWEGLNWSAVFIISRLMWLGFGFMLIYISSHFFHRFDFKQTVEKKRKKILTIETPIPKSTAKSIEFNIKALPALNFNYGIYPLVKAEFLMIIRQNSKWIWLVNGGLWVALCFMPMNMAYHYFLPVLLFLQVTRFSELVTKEKANRVHYFAYASYQPLHRMLPAQILAGLILAIGLCLPVIIRFILIGDSYAIINIVNGAMLIVLLAVAFGIVSGGKKLFEVLFFLLTYCVVSKVPFTAYLGTLPQQHVFYFIAVVCILNVALLIISVMMRKYQSRHL